MGGRGHKAFNGPSTDEGIEHVFNGTLPPGLSKRALPPGLASRLGPIPAGTERVIVGGDVALIDIATGVIIDILKGVLSN